MSASKSSTQIQSLSSPTIVRYGELVPCKTAFIDAHTPGSDQKENFTIIGAGVSESPDQHVHINATPGFNIGAAGQPPKCVNSLHYHTTAEVFFVLKGKWRFFWGLHGDAGEVVLEEGDIFNIPTHVFRGFENIGTDYGMIMSVLGGDDSGGGVIWAPHVLDNAKAHGLILGDNGALYDTKKGESLPESVKPMPKMTDDELATIIEAPVESVVRDYVARYWDIMALSKNKPCKVIGVDGIIKDKPGFEVDFINRDSLNTEAHSVPKDEVLMILKGHWKLAWQEGEEILNPGDTCWIPPNTAYSLQANMSGDASLYRIRTTDDTSGPTWKPQR